MTEEWRPVVGFEGAYEVSSLGRVRSLDRVVVKRNQGPARYRGCVLRQHKRKKGGYRTVSLADHGVLTSFLVHDLVATAFLGARPPSSWVAHDDGDPDRNGAADIRYDTPSANQMDKLKHGTLQHGENHHNARLTAAEVRLIRQSSAAHEALASEYGVHPNHIYRIRAGKRWRHVV